MRIKKLLGFIVILFLAPVAAFAQFNFPFPVSVGFGFYTGYGNSVVSAERDTQQVSGSTSYGTAPYGFEGYVDIKYASFSLGFFGTGTNVHANKEISDASGIDPVNVSLRGGAVLINLSFKYPFVFSNFTLFPLLELEGNVFVAMVYSNTSNFGSHPSGTSYQFGKASDWSCFWIRGGFGGDYYFTESVFLRGIFTFGYKFASSREEGILQRLSASSPDTYNYNTSYYGVGFKIAFSIGYNFSGFSSYGSAWSGGSGRRRSGSNIYYPR